jgi:muramoyltetrapeptide carboxypeptidase LdcA involved in peptidoglycan recycling
MKKIFPPKLKSGDEIRVISPARSLNIVSEDVRNVATGRLNELGFKVTFGRHAYEHDEFASSSIEYRLEDLHEAFGDKNVKAVMTSIGGFNSNQLLDHINWRMIAKNPKVLIGYSDITALQNAIFQKTGLITYNGPHYSTFGQKQAFEYTLEYFKKCLISEDESFMVVPSAEWSNDAWYINQDDRNLLKNDGWKVMNRGWGSGTILGGNLCTFNLLQGTQYFPNDRDVVLFLEDDGETGPRTDVEFDRNLQSLISMPEFGSVRGIVVGRFEMASEMTLQKLTKIIGSKRELAHLPVIADVDFGHTDPKITFPIGGEMNIEARDKSVIEILRH